MCNKIKIILKAAEKFSKKAVDPKGKGRSVKRLQDRENGCSVTKIDELYQNAKALLNKDKEGKEFSVASKKALAICAEAIKAPVTKQCRFCGKVKPEAEFESHYCLTCWKKHFGGIPQKQSKPPYSDKTPGEPLEGWEAVGVSPKKPIEAHKAPRKSKGSKTPKPGRSAQEIAQDDEIYTALANLAQKKVKAGESVPKKQNKDKSETRKALAKMVEALELFGQAQKETPEEAWQEICQNVNWDGAPTWNEVGTMEECLLEYLEKLGGAPNRPDKQEKPKPEKIIETPSRKGEKVLGFTLTWKKVGAKGKTYTKLYATRSRNGKQQWVYIGDGNPEQKIKAKLPVLDK
jgi:tRNA(Ser,Leu) C12 N-acetylase TAN1